MVQKALDQGLGMIPINSFINIVDFQLKQVLPLEIMWNSFQRNIPIYVTDELIKVFGYKGALLMQKKSLLKSIKRFKVPIINFDNNEYKKFHGACRRHETKNDLQIDFSSLFPPVNESQGKNKTKHYLIMPRDLKKLMLVVNTDNGDAVREYMVRLEELFHLYIEYQKAYERNLRIITEKSNSNLIQEVKELRKSMSEQNGKIDNLLGINTQI